MLKRIRDFARAIRYGVDSSSASEKLLKCLLQHQLLSNLSSNPRFTDPLRLLCRGYKVYSQGHDDGILAEIFTRIGEGKRRFFEIGVQDGLECNSTFLLLQKWTGTWVEASANHAQRARKVFANYPLTVLNEFATVANVDGLVAAACPDGDLDLLSIDIDSSDYWIWEAVQTVKPRVVVIEYNATIPPHVRCTVPYPTPKWNGTNFFGASLGALTALGDRKGYRLVGCSPEGVNAFFVREDLVGDRFAAPFTAENHYEPPRYYLAGPSGHPPGFGDWKMV